MESSCICIYELQLHIYEPKPMGVIVDLSSMSAYHLFQSPRCLFPILNARFKGGCLSRACGVNCSGLMTEMSQRSGLPST
ncbi:hypothetical protein I7I50_10318 [Histoplasma capsulatum G186AR]|uniref:Uncharacterized protein n=1 Tax=Ajellomyces capsulatus TaxID=5037 RepID=A0A8H7Z853_AJECA|nr:hypothetical protein I7I52_01557 [Histoplasma capsulatum]QSS69134.1 hypothetical protein I7I50_10318 [Histoplasma capsulatum G186AR]